MTSADNRLPKRAWPLNLLAGCAFIPVLGILFGAAALSWGLVSSRPRAFRAAIVGGVGAFIQLAAIMIFGFWAASRPSYAPIAAAMARHDLYRIADALEKYRTAHGDYPGSLQTLAGIAGVAHFVPINDRMGGVLHPLRTYHYELASDGRHYDLFSPGRDGVPYTVDDIRPDPDSMPAMNGYLPRPEAGDAGPAPPK